MVVTSESSLDTEVTSESACESHSVRMSYLMACKQYLPAASTVEAVLRRIAPGKSSSNTGLIISKEGRSLDSRNDRRIDKVLRDPGSTLHSLCSQHRPTRALTSGAVGGIMHRSPRRTIERTVCESIYPYGRSFGASISHIVIAKAYTAPPR